jgi:hypothetical protein
MGWTHQGGQRNYVWYKSGTVPTTPASSATVGFFQSLEHDLLLLLRVSLR